MKILKILFYVVLPTLSTSTLAAFAVIYLGHWTAYLICLPMIWLVARYIAEERYKNKKQGVE